MRLLRSTAKRRDGQSKKVYVDDGYSGTTTNRPDLQRMFHDVEKGCINVVVTKDYSRLGRDNLFTEHLREIFFPKHECHYVAINDNIDTRYDDEIAPFKALFNAQYSKDISKKVHSAYMNQALKGRSTGCVAPFGYLKDPEDGTHLINDFTLKAIAQLRSQIQTNIHYVVSNDSIDEAIFRLENDVWPEGINAVVFLLYKPVGFGVDKKLIRNDNRIKSFMNAALRKKHYYKIGFDTCFTPILLDYQDLFDVQSIDSCEEARF